MTLYLGCVNNNTVPFDSSVHFDFLSLLSELDKAAEIVKAF